MSTHNMAFLMENLRKLSQNYRQILLNMHSGCFQTNQGNKWTILLEKMLVGMFGSESILF